MQISRLQFSGQEDDQEPALVRFDLKMKILMIENHGFFP